MSEKAILALGSKHYDPLSTEGAVYKLWEENRVFSANPKSGKPPYSIVIPPPNVTGRLHMGHALNNSVQDALIRYKRMCGYDALWVPGTDHAGISTQSVVKKHLDAQGVNYLELGREKVIEKIWEWKAKYGDQILNQLRRLGCSCDWSRTRFTMDEGCSAAVRHAFKKLYDDGLIYRGKYIVNWCPVDRTALSDDEVITTEGGEPGHFWYIRYPLVGKEGSVTVATTRPETMLGDVAIAVNPKDERYAHLVGSKVTLPLVGRELPIIADDYVDKEYGTGFLKVTPAHDPNDFQIGLRHNLPQINIMNDDGTLGDGAPVRYHGLDRFTARDRIVEELRSGNFLEKVEDRMTPVGRAQRSRAVIEYRLSDQWFVRMKPLAENALQIGEREGLHMVPERWGDVYKNWLVNTRDWCISRQIWWGHRIPAWYHRETGEILVDVEIPERVKGEPALWKEENDVLDTWFSSALWPYSTLGWPAQTEDLQRYYPTSVLSTAKDIIYFWVARMVMTGVQFMHHIPFKEVYFHPVICDARGETMSKSKGNGIDPLHVIDGATVQELEGPIKEARPENMEQMLRDLHKHYPQGFKGVGADALRITLLSLNSQAQQVQLSLEKFEEIGQRFITKLWNASKFAFMNLEDVPAGEPAPEHLEDMWILSRLDGAINRIHASLERYVFHDAIDVLSRFFWDDFCDWYLEIAKFRLRSAQLGERKRVQLVLADVMSKVLRLFHPFIPYITEGLWSHLHEALGRSDIGDRLEDSSWRSEICALTNFPASSGREEGTEFSFLQDIARAIRNIRSSVGIEPAVQLAVIVMTSSNETAKVILDNKEILVSLLKLKSMDISASRPEKMAAAVLSSCEVFVNIAEHLDVEAEVKRNQAALAKVEKEIARYEQKLANPQFRERAPKAIQETEEKSLAVEKEKRAKIFTAIADLEKLRD